MVTPVYEKNLEKLPLWPIVAIAVRAAQRILPMIEFPTNHNKWKNYKVTLEETVEIIQDFVAGKRYIDYPNVPIDIFPRSATEHIAKIRDFASSQNEHLATNVAEVIYSAARAVYNVVTVVEDFDDNGWIYQNRGMRHAINAIKIANCIPEIIPNIRMDYKKIKDFYNTDKFPDLGSRIDTTENGILGQLWSKGFPKNWPLLFLCGIEVPSRSLIEVVSTLNIELIKYLNKHPEKLYTIKPRIFEELIAELLAHFGWEIQLTPTTKDGGYDIFAISKDITGVETSWIIECKRYSPKNKVGIEIVRGLYCQKNELHVANAMVATTSQFTQGVYDFKASRYDFALRDFEGILEWINMYHPHPNGMLYMKEKQLIIPEKY